VWHGTMLEVLADNPIQMSEVWWRDVLGNGSLLGLLNSRRDVAELFFTDSEMRQSYADDGRLFTMAVRNLHSLGVAVDSAAVRAEVSRQARSGRAAGSNPAAVASTEVSAVPAAARGWVGEVGNSVELRELVATSGRREVIEALVEEPHLLALFSVRPDVVATLNQHPQRVSEYRFGGHVTSEADLVDFQRAFGGFLVQHDLRLDADELAALGGQAQISWSQVRAQHEERNAALEQERQARFAEFDAVKPQTWTMSGRILYGNKLGPEDL